MKQFQYVEIAGRMEEQINNDTHPPGSKLPSLRVVCRHYQVSLGTAIKAFSLLADKGLVAAREKSGYVVLRKSHAHTAVPEPARTIPAVREVKVSRVARCIPPDEEHLSPKYISFFNAVPDTAMIPFNGIRRSIQQAVRDLGGSHLLYEPPAGNTRLKAGIARLSFYWDGNLAADDIVVTNGALEAISLCLRAVTQPGDTVVVESPCYYGILQCLETLQLKVIELPCHPESGIDTTQLEQLVIAFKVAACLFTSNFNNPNGVTLSADKKAYIAGFAYRHRLPVIEDDVYGDLYFGEHRPANIKTYDKHGWVLLCGSFSKTVAPGYRVGWCAPGRFTAAVTRLKATTNIATAGILQLSVASLLDTGAYNRHLRKLRPMLHRQVLLTAQCIENTFPPGKKISRPDGGMVLWVELPRGVDAVALQQATLHQQINIAPGPLFSATGAYRNYVRISCNNTWNKRVEKALTTIGKIALQLAGG